MEARREDAARGGAWVDESEAEEGHLEQMKALAEIVLSDGGRGSRICTMEDTGGALEIRLDVLELADQYSSLAYWLCGDPVGARDCLARAIQEQNALPVRVNILPSALPWRFTETLSGPTTGQLATICGVVIGIEGHANFEGCAFEVWSRQLVCRRCEGEPFEHLEGSACMSCPHCGSGEVLLAEHVANRTLVACKYVALALERATASTTASSPVRRACIVRLQDSLSKMAVGLGTRLQVIGVPLVVDSERHTTSLEKMANVSTAKRESECELKTIFFAWNVKVKTYFPTLLPWQGHATLPRRLARRRTAPGPYDSPMPQSFNRRIVAPPSNMSFASDMEGAYLVPDAEEMEEAALQLNRILDSFLPRMPYWRLRLSVLLALVSGNPLIPIDSGQVAGRVKAMRDNVHLLVGCGMDSWRVTGQILQAAKSASMLPTQCVHGGLQPTFVVDKSKTSWRIETSALLQANGGTAFVHDLTAITNKSDVAAMASCLSSQTITLVKEQCTATVPCIVSIIAVLPPEDVASKKKFKEEWLRHFDLVCVLQDVPDDALEDVLSAALLDASDEQPEGGALSEWLLASSHTLVCFSPEAHCLLTAFFKATRKAMAHCNGYHYQIEPLTRIASAIAKLRQARAVEMPDVVLAVSLNEETRAANGLNSALNFQVLPNGKSNTELMHGEFCEALVKLSVRVFNLCYEYGTLNSEE